MTRILQVSVLFIFLSIGLVVNADQNCEDWTASTEAQTLGHGDFSLRLYGTIQKPEMHKDISVICSLVLPPSEDRTLSRLCIQGKIDAALPFLSQLASKERGLHDDLRISRFSLKSSSTEGAIFTVTTSKKTNYTAPSVNCEGCSVQNEQNQDAINCSDTGTCTPVQREWTEPVTREILVPSCSMPVPKWF